MADQDRNETGGMSADSSQSSQGSQGSQSSRNQPSSDQNQSTRNTPRSDNAQGEQDDVAEDRNLSGASTWLNLPDQPKGDPSSDDSNDRQSNR